MHPFPLEGHQRTSSPSFSIRTFCFANTSQVCDFVVTITALSNAPFAHAISTSYPPLREVPLHSRLSMHWAESSQSNS